MTAREASVIALPAAADSADADDVAFSSVTAREVSVIVLPAAAVLSGVYYVCWVHSGVLHSDLHYGLLHSGLYLGLHSGLLYSLLQSGW